MSSSFRTPSWDPTSPSAARESTTEEEEEEKEAAPTLPQEILSLPLDQVKLLTDRGHSLAHLVDRKSVV